MSTPLDVAWHASTWQQFGAAIDMLDDALLACPEDLWHERLLSDRSEGAQFSAYWYVVFHTLFWLDLYLTGAVEGFMPPAPFTLAELEAGLLPERPYTKDELHAYLLYGRTKCQTTIETLTDEQARRRCRFGWGEVSFAELLLYTMRHVQEHAAQLNLFLGQRLGSASGWVAQARQEHRHE
jgi:hypothetical protein